MASKLYIYPPMLPINETIKIDGVKYKVKSLEDGTYQVDGGGLSFVLTQNEKWEAPEEVSKILTFKLGKQIEELIWFRASGI